MERSQLLQEILQNECNGPLPSLDEIKNMNDSQKEKIFQNQEKIIQLFKERITEKINSLNQKLKNISEEIETLQSQTVNDPQITFVDNEYFSKQSTEKQFEIIYEQIKNTRTLCAIDKM